MILTFFWLVSPYKIKKLLLQSRENVINIFCVAITTICQNTYMRKSHSGFSTIIDMCVFLLPHHPIVKIIMIFLTTHCGRPTRCSYTWSPNTFTTRWRNLIWTRGVAAPTTIICCSTTSLVASTQKSQVSTNTCSNFWKLKSKDKKLI